MDLEILRNSARNHAVLSADADTGIFFFFLIRFSFLDL